MFDDISNDDLLNNMLASVDDSMDKRPSSLIYAALAAVSIELLQAYINLDYVNEQAFADTADRQHLIMKARELGLMPKPATESIMRGKFNIDVPIESRFSALNSTYNFYVSEPCVLDTDGFYYAKMRCETKGNINEEELIGHITPINTSNKAIEMEGLTTADLVEVVERGADEESTESFRARYFLESQWEHYGGNISDYENMIGLMPGYGAVKVIPVWQGAGTVKLVVADAEMLPPSAENIVKLQEEIDPAGFEGLGYGKAPIDHKVTVEAVGAVTINVALTITYKNGQSWTTLGDAIKEAIETYIAEVRANWKQSDGLIVRLAHVESAVLDVNGVLDITTTTLNGVESNITLDEYSVPILGAVTG